VSEPEAAPILLLEDDRVTAALIGQLLAAQRITNPALVMRTGAAATDYLARAAAGSEPLPVLCVLDLSLPDVSGLEVLRQIRACDALAAVPVIMLTGSGADADITGAYELGIDAYLVKPAGLHGLPDVIRELRLPHELKRSTREAPPASDGGGEGA
jgi:DNA-binding response OmpR family regulator